MDLRFLAYVAIGLPLSGCGGEQAQRDADPATRIEALDASSRASFGVGVVALGMLMEADPGSVFLAEGFAKDGRDAALAELEREGYVSINRFETPEGRMLTIARTEKAQPVVDALKHSIQKRK